MSENSDFNYDAIPEGYYDRIARGGNSVRRAWHLQKFERVLDCIPDSCKSILDVGCFAGTFLSELSPVRFPVQVGVDVLPKQVEYANAHYGSEFRKFVYVPSVAELGEVPGSFDCITLIEVIEHLTVNEIRTLLERLCDKLNVGGKLVLSTPNYTSSWPVLEVLVNHLSTVSYEEQHLTKFNYFNVEKRLREISPVIGKRLRVDFKTTTHFVSPFIAPLSLELSRSVSRLYPHNKWHFPFGNLVLVRLERIS
ncbi:MAG: class I SAM-dependent methyltransferase [Bdellovibrionaceae bacterium]|nr:class I SAM-dependent methyltransferase [Bdellovibrionales bacterium]MCB9254091.1 class I SAM-dependent methyltransferase [Pseudobdellovibrionaceae bacterium]